MKSDVTLNVLWIDDEDLKNISATAKEEYNIQLTRVGSWEEAMPLMKDGNYKQWDAVILDCYCLLEKGGPQEDNFLKIVLHEMAKIVGDKDVLPWYVLSAGQKGNFNDILDRDLNNDRLLWDAGWNDIAYRKTGKHEGKSDVKWMFENIVNWVSSNSNTVKLKKRFRDVFGIDNELDNLLLSILPNLESDRTTNASVFNEVRKVMEWLMKYCNNTGLLIEKFTDTNLAACVKELHKRPASNYVTIDVLQCMDFVEEMSQNGSHRMKIDKLVRDGERPFLIKSVIYSMLNILTWCKTLPTDEYERHELWKEMKPAWDKRNPDRIECYEGITFVLEKDEMGFIHCGKCLVNNHFDTSIGKSAILEKVVENTDKKTNKEYPLYASYIVIVEH